MTSLGIMDEWAGMDLTTRRGNDHEPSWFAGLDGLADRYDMIIVGAGISGCVFAERGSKELGLKSLIIAAEVTAVDIDGDEGAAADEYQSMLKRTE